MSRREFWARDRLWLMRGHSFDTVWRFEGEKSLIFLIFENIYFSGMDLVQI